MRVVLAGVLLSIETVGDINIQDTSEFYQCRSVQTKSTCYPSHILDLSGFYLDS